MASASAGSAAESRLLAGRCECGTVGYRVADAFLYASNCHCSLRPAKHIFVGSKAPWFEITDSLPQFDEHAK